MGTRGYIAYRYKGKYYRRYLFYDAYPSGHGQQFADKIPREPSAFNEWLIDTIKMLENANTSDEEVVQPYLSDSDSTEDDDHLGYELCEDPDWTFPYPTEYTYVIDLDNRVFTLNGGTHLKLDNMPPEDLEEYFDEDGISVPPQYLSTTVNLWPDPAFDIKERTKKYEALRPIVTPATKWGTPSWDQLSFPQRFSVDLTHHLLAKTSSAMAFAYASSFQEGVGLFCWNILCAAATSVPHCCDTTGTGDWYSQTLSTAPPTDYSRLSVFRLRPMVYDTGAKHFKGRNYYCRIRDCLITFCLRLNDPAHVAHEVEQMVQRIREDGHTECTGIILSSQQEILFVAVDDGLEETRQVRHTPVLDIRPCPGKPGEASEGLLLMVQLLSPIMTVPQLPWRTSRSRTSSVVWLWPKLPLEVFQRILHYTDTSDYVSLCRVSRSTRSVCLSNPRFSDYTLLYKVPGHELNYIAQRACDDSGTHTELSLYWDRSARNSDSRWNARDLR